MVYDRAVGAFLELTYTQGKSPLMYTALHEAIGNTIHYNILVSPSTGAGVQEHKVADFSYETLVLYNAFKLQERYAFNADKFCKQAVRKDSAFVEFRNAVTATVLLAQQRHQEESAGVDVKQYAEEDDTFILPGPERGALFLRLAKEANVSNEELDMLDQQSMQEAQAMVSVTNDVQWFFFEDNSVLLPMQARVDGTLWPFWSAVIPTTVAMQMRDFTNQARALVADEVMQTLILNADEAMQKLILEEENLAAPRQSKTARRKAKKKAMRAAAAGASDAKQAGAGDEEPPDDGCVVCMDSKAACAFVPCGHLAACEACAKAISLQHGCCPKCRGALDAGSPFLRIYA